MKKILLFICFLANFVVSLHANDTIPQTKDSLLLSWDDAHDLYKTADKANALQELTVIQEREIAVADSISKIQTLHIRVLEDIVRKDSDMIDNLFKVNSARQIKSDKDEADLKELRLRLKMERAAKRQAIFAGAGFALVAAAVIFSDRDDQ